MIQFAVGSLGALGFLVPLGKRCRAVWRLAQLRRPLLLGGCQCPALGHIHLANHQALAGSRPGGHSFVGQLTG